jgi:phosphohistidine phosphatase
MEIFVLRHGEAEAQEAGIPDADRKLTPKGKQALKAVLEAARRAKTVPELILSSPLRRAQETAAMAAEALRCQRVVETRNLLPGASPDRLWKELGGYPDVTQVVLAGHEPHLSFFITFLLEAAVLVDLKKGALVRITTRERHGPPRGVLKWMITPKLARALD